MSPLAGLDGYLAALAFMVVLGTGAMAIADLPAVHVAGDGPRALFGHEKTLLCRGVVVFLTTDGVGRTATLASRTEGSYETHFLTERSDLKRRSFAGASLCF